MALSQRSKLAPKDLGAPALIKTMPENQKAYLVGTFVGIATGIIKRKNPKDENEVFEGLSGSFRAIPSVETLDELESGVLFIPDAFHNMIAAALAKVQKDDPTAELRFAIECSSVRANNPAGYSWDFKPLFDQGKNPLDELVKDAGVMKIANGQRRLQITGPADAAPAKKK